jgi:hypothetical protein
MIHCEENTMSRSANRRRNKKRKQFCSQHHRSPPAALQRALGKKLEAWGREARRRANALRPPGEAAASVRQLRQHCRRFILALHLPTLIERETLEELDECLRQSFHGIMPYCPRQLNANRQRDQRRPA